jgi:prolipoprotein diacylglyceryl transferase
VPIRAYALCIVAGIIVAIWLGQRRWVARGGSPLAVGDVAIWAVPFGIVGSRIYHVITDNQLYFGEGRDPWTAFEIWGGGISIWGAIAGGAIGAWIACRRKDIPLPAMADALAPGILLAQAIGRFGNWFNQELYGKPSDLPWAVEIAADADSRRGLPIEYRDVETFHPTFLYEALWAVAVALLLIFLDKKFTIGHGRVFALYVMGYTMVRSLTEYIRIDPANEVLGLRVNQWVTGVVFLGALAYFVISLRKRPGREDPAGLWGNYPREDEGDEAGESDASEDGKNDAESEDAEAESDDEAGEDVDAKSDEVKADSDEEIKSDEVKADSDEARADSDVKAGEDVDTPEPAEVPEAKDSAN